MTDDELRALGYTDEGIAAVRRGVQGVDRPPPATKAEWEAEAEAVRKIPGMEEYDYVPEHLK